MSYGDWSEMAIEYALGLGKPLLFVDVPPRVRDVTYAELALEPMEMRIRHEFETVFPLDHLADAPQYVAALLRGAVEFRKRGAALREEWAFNFGGSVEVGRGKSLASPTTGPAPAHSVPGSERRSPGRRVR